MTLLMITLIILMWSIFDVSLVFLHIHFLLLEKSPFLKPVDP